MYIYTHVNKSNFTFFQSSCASRPNIYVAQSWPQSNKGNNCREINVTAFRRWRSHQKCVVQILSSKKRRNT